MNRTRIADGIRALDRAYDLPANAAVPSHGMETELKRGERQFMKYEIITQEGTLLLSYLFHCKRYPGYLSFIVPMRNGLSKLTLKSRAKPGGSLKKTGFFSRIFAARGNPRARSASYNCIVLEEGGLTIHAHHDLRAKGVVSDYHKRTGTGCIKAGARLSFRKEWILEGSPEVGTEVSYVPLIMVGRRLQARAIRPLQSVST